MELKSSGTRHGQSGGHVFITGHVSSNSTPQIRFSLISYSAKRCDSWSGASISSGELSIACTDSLVAFLGTRHSQLERREWRKVEFPFSESILRMLRAFVVVVQKPHMGRRFASGAYLYLDHKLHGLQGWDLEVSFPVERSHGEGVEQTGTSDPVSASAAFVPRLFLVVQVLEFHIRASTSLTCLGTVGELLRFLCFSVPRTSFGGTSRSRGGLHVDPTICTMVCD